jgi:hypothetical protein
VKKKEKYSKKRETVDKSQCIQITASSDFIEKEGENIKTGWSRYLGVPVPVVATTILLNLTDMEDLILESLVNLLYKEEILAGRTR